MNTYVNKMSTLSGVPRRKPMDLFRGFENRIIKGVQDDELIEMRTRLYLMKNDTLTSYEIKFKVVLLNSIEKILEIRNKEFEEETIKMSKIIEMLEKDKKTCFYYDEKRNEIGYEDFETDYVSYWMPYIVFNNNMQISKLPYSSLKDDLWLFVLREKEVEFINDVNGGENF